VGRVTGQTVPESAASPVWQFGAGEALNNERQASWAGERDIGFPSRTIDAATKRMLATVGPFVISRPSGTPHNHTGTRTRRQ
jgi:hypothetical protein